MTTSWPPLTALKLFDKRDVPQVSTQILRGFVQGKAQLDTEVLTKQGLKIPYYFTACTVDFKGRTCLVGMGIDISERKRAEGLLRHSALHDSLTGLANRSLMDERLNDSIASAGRADRCIAVIFLDVDRFKNINDTLGHRVGDELLKAVARRLAVTFRAADTVARLGGDEFVIVTEIEDAMHGPTAVEHLVEAFRKPFAVLDMELHVTASVGFSLFPRDGVTAESLLRNADTAMYIAKDRGRNTWFSFASEMHVAAARRLSTEHELRRALKNGEFELYYQPAIDMRTGETVAAEALIRWQHPSRGLLPPSEFIDIAEDTGLIVPIGAWVLREGALQAKRLSELGAPACHISVNVSGRQLRDPDFANHVRGAVEGLRLDPGALGIEITESAALGDPDRALAALNVCKSLGLLVLLDDFGTHYSSLTYLKKFPIDVIKIDKSFVDGLPGDLDDVGIVNAITGLARNLDCGVLAEGKSKVSRRLAGLPTTTVRSAPAICLQSRCRRVTSNNGWLSTPNAGASPSDHGRDVKPWANGNRYDA